MHHEKVKANLFTFHEKVKANLLTFHENVKANINFFLFYGDILKNKISQSCQNYLIGNF